MTGIALLVDSVTLVDLRLPGLAKSRIPVTLVMHYLLPVTWAGFALVAMSGAGMFSAIAVAAGGSAVAPWKFGTIIFAGFNAWIFHKVTSRSLSEWDINASPPVAVKIQALLSSVGWVVVIFLGRFLTY